MTDKGVEVIGVSGDTPKTQELFKKQHKLGFTLLGDDTGAVAKVFGVPTKPGAERTIKVDGNDVKVKTGVFASRWTFVIGKDGNIAYINPKASAADDSKTILGVVEKLGK